MDNHPVKVLWDTGAQSSIINEPWRKRHLPHTITRPISELLEGETLTVLAANDTPIPYIGWIEVSFRLDSDSRMKSDLQVPILVSGDPAVASDPIIGYNVIEAIINRQEGNTTDGRKQLTHRVSKAFAITVKTAHNVVKLMQDSVQDTETGVVRTGGKVVRLPANQVTTVYIRAHVSSQARGQDMYFSPDICNPTPEGVVLSEVLVRVPERKIPYVPIPMINTTNHVIFLNGHQVVGHLESVKTVYSAAIQTKDQQLSPDQTDKYNRAADMSHPTPQSGNKQEERPVSWDPPVELDHLPEGQQRAAKAMLREECQAFAYDSDDVG